MNRYVNNGFSAVAQEPSLCVEIAVPGRDATKAVTRRLVIRKWVNFHETKRNRYVDIHLTVISNATCMHVTARPASSAFFICLTMLLLTSVL